MIFSGIKTVFYYHKREKNSRNFNTIRIEYAQAAKQVFKRTQKRPRIQICRFCYHYIINILRTQQNFYFVAFGSKLNILSGIQARYFSAIPHHIPGIVRQALESFIHLLNNGNLSLLGR